MTTDQLFDYYVIFGARVNEGGVPSGTLRRRVEGAYSLGGTRADSRYIVTGGVGDHPPAEADVMAELLQALGVPDSQIVRDRTSADTLASVRTCASLIDLCGNMRRVVICSSPYHTPRCQILFLMMGIHAERGKMPSDLAPLGLSRWLYFCCREIVAIPYDVLLVVLGKIIGRKEAWTWP